MEEKCRPYLAFTTDQGHFEFQTVPFGLNNSPSVFTRMMRKLIQPIDRPGITHFVDDILIATPTWAEHVETITALLARLRETGLTARPSKCMVGFNKLKFLGHMIEKNKIMPDETKVEKIKLAPQPTTKSGIRSLLGLTGYYQKFIPEYNSIAAPLTDLTRKNLPEKVTWSTECQLAFDQLKTALTSKPILRLPDPTRPYVLKCDASGRAVGAALLQPDPEHDNMLFPVAYASRKLNATQMNYSTSELECWALVFGIEKFHVYLYGRHFILHTDHQPLTFLACAKNLNRRLMRYSLTLSQYSFQTIYQSGKEHHLADFLSRYSDSDPALDSGPTDTTQTLASDSVN